MSANIDFEKISYNVNEAFEEIAKEEDISFVTLHGLAQRKRINKGFNIIRTINKKGETISSSVDSVFYCVPARKSFFEEERPYYTESYRNVVKSLAKILIDIIKDRKHNQVLMHDPINISEYNMRDVWQHELNDKHGNGVGHLASVLKNKADSLFEYDINNVSNYDKQDDDGGNIYLKIDLRFASFLDAFDDYGSLGKNPETEGCVDIIGDPKEPYKKGEILQTYIFFDETMRTKDIHYFKDKISERYLYYKKILYNL